VRYNQGTFKISVPVDGKRERSVARGRRGLSVDTSLLEAALVGFEQMKKNVDEKIAGIRQQLGSGGTVAAAAPRRTLSASARRRIAAAQRKRWAAVKAQAKPAAQKRTMSAAARNRIAAAQRKRWAELKKAQAKKPAVKAAAKKAAAPEKAATAAG
jgi:hypothetical protein